MSQFSFLDLILIFSFSSPLYFKYSCWLPSPFLSLSLTSSLPPSTSTPLLLITYIAVGGFADVAVRNGLKDLDLNSTQKLRANTAASVGIPVLTLPKGTCASPPALFPIISATFFLFLRIFYVMIWMIFLYWQVIITAKADQHRQFCFTQTCWIILYKTSNYLASVFVSLILINLMQYFADDTTRRYLIKSDVFYSIQFDAIW